MKGKTRGKYYDTKNKDTESAASVSVFPAFYTSEILNPTHEVTTIIYRLFIKY